MALVPIRTPMFDSDGTVQGRANVKSLGNLNRIWALFFTEAGDWVSAGTHQQRTSYLTAGYVGAASVPDGALFAETDRDSLYQSRLVGTSNPVATWVFVTGSMSGPYSSIPTDLGPNDAGFIFNDTDGLSYEWSGTAWVTLQAGLQDPYYETPRRYDQEIEDLRRLISSLEAQGGAASAGASGTDTAGTVFANGLATTIGAVTIPTAGYPGAYTSAVALGQTASIGSTNIQLSGAPLPAGRYLVTITTGMGAGTGNLTGSLTWHNPEGIAGTANFGPGGSTSAITSSTAVAIRTDGTTNLAFSTTLTGSATYSVTIDVVRIA